MNKEEALKYINGLSDDDNIIVMVENDADFIRGEELDKYQLSKSKLHYWVKNGYVRTIHRGRQYRYSKSDIEKMLK